MSRFSRDRGAESGELLIEVLMATAILAIGVVAIIGGFATTMLGSSVHREQASGNAILVSGVEAMKSRTVARVACDPGTNDLTPGARDSYLGAARGSLPAGWAPTTMDIESVLFQQPGGSFGTACLESPTSPLSLQLITLKLDVPGDRVTNRVTFVKGDD